MFSLLKNIGVDVFSNRSLQPEELDVAQVDEHDPAAVRTLKAALQLEQGKRKVQQQEHEGEIAKLKQHYNDQLAAYEEENKEMRENLQVLQVLILHNHHTMRVYMVGCTKVKLAIKRVFHPHFVLPSGPGLRFCSVLLKELTLLTICHSYHMRPHVQCNLTSRTM
jgi:hypothetical protein